ncbi:MAG: hypothetical protein MJ252_04865 [archaeon]|nr:hypothetical protein [archaeon]
MSYKPTEILSVSIIYFIYFISSFISLLIDTSKSIYDSLANISLKVNGIDESSIINNSKNSISYPKNIGIILNQEQNISQLILSLILFIKRCLLSEIKHLTIYDPFDYFNNEAMKEKIINLLCNNLSKNHNIGIAFTKDKCINCKDKKVINKSKISSFNFDITISVIGFKSGNQNLLKNYLKNEKYFPEQIEVFFEDNSGSRFNKEYPKTYQKFYTRKKAEGLPEMIIFFGNKEICLQGFPFTLLENCEIKQSKSEITEMELMDFVEIFRKYSKTNKRFGK